PGMLHAAVVRSPHAHAEIESIRTEEALALNGVRAILTAADLPDVRFGLLAADEPILAVDRVRYVGDRVAVVAAVDAETALEAARRVKVRYRPLPAVLSVEEAARDGSPLVHPGVDGFPGGAFGMELVLDGNRCYEEETVDGDVDAAFEHADVVLDETYRTAPQHQASIEPHAAVAAPRGDGGVAIWTSTQAPFIVRQGVAAYLGLPMSQVRVVAMETGGAFGGKVSVFIEPMVAALALKTGQPVRMVYSRQEELEDARPRSATVIRVRTAAQADGTLLAREVDFLADSGAYADWTPAVVNSSLRACRGPYRVPNLRAKGAAVYTHKFNTGPFRAPGYPQLTFALESHMDELAAKLGMDPMELRRKNLLRNGEKTFSGTELKTDVLMRCFDTVTKAIADDPADEPHTAWGLACGEWEIGGFPASALLKVNEDGTVSLSVGSTDLTGSLTSIAQVVADELGIEMTELSASCIDTDTSPLAPLSGGSMVTYNMTHVAREGAKQLADELKKRAATALEAKPSQMEVSGLKVRLKKDPSKSVSFAGLVANEPAGITITTPALPATHSFAVHAVKVSVSPETGEVRVLRAISALDCGKAINPNMVKGQMCGGLVQGLGECLWEEIRFDGEGRVANIGFGDYRLPTAADVPEIECHIVEGETSTSRGHGCKGVGEPAHVPALAAAANAVCAAIGRRIYESPLSPERILGA
ncbi:MAG TPA: xanthine dehydrogenase family protein molybdopterin-binding subunit, partial [Armatimonadota bacterium]|nr:xanthine dehydrogenase family protein molybdopterin-binding subunit [Armatimonadota bacterium]